MSASGYQRPAISPTGIAAAIGVNVLILGALATSAPQIFVAPPEPFIAYTVPDDPPPPPMPPEAKPETKVAHTDPRLSTPDPVIATVPPVNTVAGTIDVPPLPPLPGNPGAGTGDGTVTVDPPRPMPVLVDAAPDPRYARDFQPDYPPSERRAANEGAVTVRVRIGIDGRVIAIERVTAASDAFFEATRRQALARWRFRAATRDGVAVESWRTMTVRFVMEG